MSFKTPTPYLRGQTYYFRLRIPADLLPLYNGKEVITASLKTKDSDTAQERSRLKSIELDQEFREKRRLLAYQKEQGLSIAATPAPAAAPASSPDVPAQQLPPLLPFGSMPDTERQRLLLLYRTESLRAAHKRLTQPPAGDEAQARKEWQERQELMQQLEGPAFRPEQPPAFFPMSAACRERLRGDAACFCEAAPLCLRDGDIAPVLPLVEDFLHRHGYALPEQTPAAEPTTCAEATEEQAAAAEQAAVVRACFHKFCMEVLGHETEVQRWAMAWLDGEPWALQQTPDSLAFASSGSSGSVGGTIPTNGSGGLPAPVSLFNPPAPTAQQDDPMQEGPDNPRFSKVCEAYIREKGESIAESTVKDIRHTAQRFIELNGDLPIRAYSKRKHLIAFKDALIRLPTFWTRILPNAPLPRILKELERRQGEFAGRKRLTATTVNNSYLAYVRVVFNYAEANAYIEVNPCAGVQAIDNRPETDEGKKQLPYTEADLACIFQHSALFNPTDPQAPGRMGNLSGPTLRDYRWFLLLGLYTGARIEELAQLDRADVKQEEGVWYIHIHADAATGRRVKNRASVRKVPLHRHLLELGFVERFAKAGTETGGKLFASFTRRANGHRSNGFSKGYGRFIDSLELENGDRKRFHSFRHTLKRFGRQAQVPDGLLDGLQGHTQQGVSAQYGLDEEGRQYNLTVLKTALDKIDYGMDCNKLSQILK